MTTSADPFNQIEAEIDNMSEIEVLNELQSCRVEVLPSERPKDVAKRLLRWLRGILQV